MAERIIPDDDSPGHIRDHSLQGLNPLLHFDGSGDLDVLQSLETVHGFSVFLSDLLADPQQDDTGGRWESGLCICQEMISAAVDRIYRHCEAEKTALRSRRPT